MGMLELRENLSLSPEAPENVIGVEAAFDDIDCDQLFKLLVRARAQINRAESTAADLADHSIGTELPPHQVFVFLGLRQEMAWDRGDWILDKTVGPLVRGEQRLHLSAQRFIPFRGALEQGRTLLGRKVDGFVK